MENCLKKGDPNLLAFASDAVLERATKYGDLFEPVLKLKQKMPSLEALESQTASPASVAATVAEKPARLTKTKTKVAAKKKAPSKKAPARKRG